MDLLNTLVEYHRGEGKINRLISTVGFRDYQITCLFFFFFFGLVEASSLLS